MLAKGSNRSVPNTMQNSYVEVCKLSCQMQEIPTQKINERLLLELTKRRWAVLRYSNSPFSPQCNKLCNLYSINGILLNF